MERREGSDVFGWTMEENPQQFDVLRPAPVRIEKPDNGLPKCQYCMCDIPDCLVQCKETGKYFCNGVGKVGGQISHIVHHMVKSKSREIILPECNQYSKVPLQCYFCKTSNIFLLSFVQSGREGNFYVVCRDCMNSTHVKEYEFDTQNKQMLISNNRLLTWVVRPPDSEEAKRFTLDLKKDDMDLLEDCWAKGEKVTIKDLPQIRQREQLTPTKTVYRSIEEYCEIMEELVKAEMQADKEAKEAMKLSRMVVTWQQIGEGRSWLAKFKPTSSEAIGNLNPGDSIMLVDGNEEYNGVISNIRFDNEVTVRVNGYTNVPGNDVRLDIHFVFDGTSYVRQLDALKRLSIKGTTAQVIKDTWLGNPPKHYEPMKTVEVTRAGLWKKSLNDSQLKAVTEAISRPFTLIQGPPGTGKTTTIAAYVHNVLKQFRGTRILVCGPSNISVEHLTLYIAQLQNVKVVRLVSRALDGIDSIVDSLTVNTMIYNWPGDRAASTRLRALRDKQETSYLTEKEAREYEQIRSKLEGIICAEADVVCCTTAAAGCKTLSGLKFDRVVIDEATQATEPLCLIPILHDSHQVVLVGDHMQLGPTILSPKAKAAGLETSIVQRLVDRGIKPVMLQVQYRMHPELSKFPSNFFYGGNLMNGISSSERTPARAVFPWPNPQIPMLFYASKGEEERAQNGVSFINREEALIVVNIIDMLCRAGVAPKDIGVVTPYAGQKSHIKDYMQSAARIPMEFCEYIQVASVDSFQGGERDYIIMSCVRCNNTKGIGFLSDQRRLNVSITRAKKGLIIVGSVKVLQHNRQWHALLTHFQSLDLIVSGDLNALKPFPFVLQPLDNKKKQRKGARSVPEPEESYVENDDVDYFA